MPNLTLVSPSSSTDLDEEFVPLPFYPWDERPLHLEVSHDEAATALHLARGDLVGAAVFLKVPFHRLNRLVRRSPRLAHIRAEALQYVLARAANVAIDTLFDPSADARRLEWASTKVLQSRLAQGDPLSPGSPSSSQSLSLTQTPASRTVTFRWRTDADDVPSADE